MTEACLNAPFTMSPISILLARYVAPNCPLSVDVILCQQAGTETMIEEWLNKKYEGIICRIVREKKEDLKLPNHLMGHRRLYLQLCFRNVSDLLTVRRDIVPLALANSAKRDAVDAYAEVIRATTDASMDIQFEDDEDGFGGGSRSGKPAAARDQDPRECIIDVREYDVPYYLRVAIDNDMRVGLWYAVTFTEGQPSFSPHGACEACRSGGHGVRYRDDKGASQVSRPGHRPGHDDFVHGRRPRLSDHEPGDCQRGHRGL